MLADPFLAARLIALAGGLKALAQKPSGTVQVLGAEDALFAHLEGHAPSPKHGIIFTHESVRGTRPADRGSAARAVAGKLAIAARIDYYRGERHADLREDLEDRIETIQQRGGAE
jgi:rRNA biogenesis protein Nop56/Nop58